MDFPVSSRRKSGFLPPTFGTQATSGLEFTLPYYWNIKPNMDYTIAPRVMSRRGVLFGNEFRYLEPTYSGQLQADFLPDDRVADRSRWAFCSTHGQNFGHGLTGGINIQRVSDDTYFTDLSDKVAATSQSVLPQEAWLKYEGGWYQLYGRTQHWQVLQDPLAPVTPPYARAPQMVLLASKQNVAGLDPGVRRRGGQLPAADAAIGLAPDLLPVGEFPAAHAVLLCHAQGRRQLHALQLSERVARGETRTLPIFSVDSGMSFERDTTLGGRNFVQTLEPRLYYLYIPFRDQTQLPVFDTALKDFDFTSIFSENKFSGGDRINDANQITAGVTTRLLDPVTGAERMRALVGQRYYLEAAGGHAGQCAAD